MDIKSELNKLFPNLPPNYNYELLSKNDGLQFNCVSYSLDIFDNWIWTNEFWPYPTVQRNPNIESYIKLYEYYGFELCYDQNIEINYNKVAFYALNGIPKHACKQYNNMWKSKIGELPVILEHKLEWIVNKNNDIYSYGDVVFYMKKKKQ